MRRAAGSGGICRDYLRVGREGVVDELGAEEATTADDQDAHLVDDVGMSVDVGLVVTILCGIGIAVGILGTVVPVLPGVLLCWLSVLAWAIFGGYGPGRWAVLAIVTIIALIGVLVQYLWPGKRLKDAGVPNRTLLLGGLLGIVGFFVLPVFGLIIGFVLGVWLAELARLQEVKPAWQSTVHALKAAGLYLIIELAAALGIATTWVLGLFLA